MIKFFFQDKASQQLSNNKPAGGKQNKNKIDHPDNSQKEGVAWFFVMMMHRMLLVLSVTVISMIIGHFKFDKW